MHLDIAPHSPVPLYRQIVDQVRRLAAGGKLQTGAELPSVRAIAAEHAINPMTVSKAYSLLEAEGVLERRRGLGMVVAATAAAHGTASSATQRAAERLALLEPALRAAAQQATQLDLNAADALALFKRCLNEQAEGAVPAKAGARADNSNL
jgi:GntR family transcriptional regulator